MSAEAETPPGAFPATQWSLVARAAGSDEAVQRPALADVITRYLPALRAYLCATRRVPSDRIEDLLQGFIADKIVEQRLLQQADRDRGRLRSLLMTSLDRYAVSQHRQDSAAKRAPSEGVTTLSETETLTPSPAPDPADQFNIEWAKQLLSEAIARSKAECDRSGRHDLWRIFDSRVLRPALEGHEPLQYQQLVDELGLVAPLQACALLTTAKRMFVRNLRAVAAEYADEAGGGVDAEIDDLRQILAGRGAQTRTGLRK